MIMRAIYELNLEFSLVKYISFDEILVFPLNLFLKSLLKFMLMKFINHSNFKELDFFPIPS